MTKFKLGMATAFAAALAFGVAACTPPAAETEEPAAAPAEAAPAEAAPAEAAPAEAPAEGAPAAAPPATTP